MNKILIAMLSGIAIGMLIAPAKGSATRERLTNGFNDLADRLDRLKEKFSSGQEDEGKMDELASSLQGTGILIVES